MVSACGPLHHSEVTAENLYPWNFDSEPELVEDLNVNWEQYRAKLAMYYTQAGQEIEDMEMDNMRRETQEQAQPKLIVFDVDGTLTTTKSGATFRKTADDWQFLPGRIEKLTALKEQGVRLACCTNQGGVAFGFMKQEDILNELIRTCLYCGIPKGGLYVCYTHPQAKLAEYRADDIRRKPGPGMLQEAMSDFGATPEETLYVGDRPEDEEASRAACCRFMWADDFFSQR